MSTRLEVRSVHESTTSPTNTPLWLLPRLPHEEHTIALTLILASFISIHSSYLRSSRGLQVVHNRGHGYSNSSLTLQGCTSSHARHLLSSHSWHHSSGCRTWMKPRQ